MRGVKIRQDRDAPGVNIRGLREKRDEKSDNDRGMETNHRRGHMSVGSVRNRIWKKVKSVGAHA